MPGSAGDRTPRISGRQLFLTGVAAFSIFAVVLFPARLAWQWLGDQAPSVSVSGIEGSVWRGSASGVFWYELPLGTVSWCWQPLALLSGEWRDLVRLESPGVRGEGGLGWRFTGAMVAADIALETSLSHLLRVAKMGPSALPVQLEGAVGVMLERLVYTEGKVEELAGVLQLDDVTAGARPAGSLRADLRHQDDGVIAEFSSLGDPSAGIEGVALWRPSGDYRLKLDIEDPEVFGDEIAGLIKGLASQGADGRWQIEWHGRF
jgi:general secretion pathway protein N